MKLRVAALIGIIGLAFFVVAFFVTRAPWNSFFLGLSGNMITLALGIVIVNQYLESRTRKSAVRSLLAMSDQYIASFHNYWLNLCWAKFGRDQFGDIAEEYISSNGRPNALRDDVRESIYDIYKNNTQLHEHIRKLEEALIELSRMAGWSLDPSILESCLNARTSISKLGAVPLDDSSKSKSKITEHLLDTDLQTGMVRAALMNVAGVTQKPSEF